MVNYPSDDIISHPNVPLAKHLLDTAENISLLFGNLSFKSPIDRDTLKSIAMIVGALHDIGKSTSFFQDYIRGIKYTKKHKIKKHSPLGSIFIYWALINSNLIQDTKMSHLFAFIASTVIAKHHGNLQNIRDEKKGLRDRISEIHEKKSVLNIQFHDTIRKKDQIDNIIHFLNLKLNNQIKATIPSWSSFISAMENKDEWKELKKSVRKVSKVIEGYDFICNGQENKKSKKVQGTEFKVTIILQIFYSLLQEADKINAMKKEIMHRPSIDFHKRLMENYQKQYGRPNTFLDQMRAKIFHEACQTATRIDPAERVFSLEAPTGGAKTVASLGWALTLKKRLANQAPFRIIYILPFTSIVDQTFTVIRENVFGKRNSQVISSNELLMHHYSTELKFAYERDNELEEEEPNVAQFFIESWTSEIIVSTFYQFFHSLFTNNKKSLRKLSKFSNSIIIMDEIQAIPIKYWSLFDFTIPKVLETLDSYLLLSTATMPGIVRYKPISISKTGKSLFGKLNRTELVWILDTIEPSSLFDELEERVDFNNLHSFVVVTNTISASQEVYNAAIQKFHDWKVFYLSASIIPKERKRRISEIKRNLNDGKRVLLISTQVIEAGVDLSFEAGYRDIAPLDSIIQTAGRINRHGEFQPEPNFLVPGGKLFVGKMIKKYENGTSRKLASFIYDPILLSLTEKKIVRITENGKKAIPETHYKEIVENYFKEAKNKEGEAKSREIAAYYCKIELSSVNQKFKLIDNDYSVPLFIEYNIEAKNLLSDYKHLKELRKKDWKQARNKYAEIKGKMTSYIINVSIKKIAEIRTDLEEETWFFILPETQLQNYYHKNVGFNVEKTEEDIVW